MFTNLLLAMFRATNLTLAWGDRLVAPMGLTSARWQILGTIVAAEKPQSVAWLARDLGANRQNVQRIVNDLLKDNIVTFEPNPHHRRSQLVKLTNEGRRRYETALLAYYPQVAHLAAHLTLSDLEAAQRVMASLIGKLQRQGSSDSPD
ncbi:MarR family winged helix-turn-helix transcriptional regulator [Sphingobium sp. AP50]|uniref:MarR family winged helix-turn-helix transcriptional regulator n=1 Tax=Sphingobium sp. AP50 TaxID=1884369 RepID=UPI001C42EE18|nr:MarR family winged helix-turn-helix transcriptional regulator [Sphingobium sp. AP50]